MYQPEAQYFLYNEFGYKTDYDKFLEYLLTFQSSLREDFFRNENQTIADVVKQEGFENASPRITQQFNFQNDRWALPKESRYALQDAVKVNGMTDYSGWTSMQVKYL